ncbi:MAG: phosphonate ABC transporter ATP-binding protein [Nannocystaceae bacterium]|nr:ATP-binding cassette domain-containing protein [bacterium]
MTPALAFADVHRSFSTGRGVRGVTATLGAGEVVALVGPSGAGKSTLLRLAAGELAPEAGTVSTGGHDLATLRGAAYRSACDRVGMLTQHDNLTPGLSVLHNVMAGRLGRWPAWLALRNRLRPRAPDVAEVESILDRLELGDRLHADPRELSGGEAQRVALARLSYQRPDLWLADEPTAGLDPRLRARALALLIEHVRDAEAAAVVALHDLELLDADVDRVWGLRDGALVFDGTPETFGADARRELYEARP